jgi:hypothetical protein
LPQVFSVGADDPEIAVAVILNGNEGDPLAVLWTSGAASYIARSTSRAARPFRCWS